MVPRVWPSSTIVCLGSGPSLTAADLSLVQQSSAKAIAINLTFRSAPWAHVLFAPDVRFWGWYPDALDFKGLKFGLERGHAPGVVGLEWTGESGIEESPAAVRTGGHAGYAAINVAKHLGAKRILLLGYDLGIDVRGRHHHHDDHPNGSHPNYGARRAVYATCLEPLRELGVTIFNVSRATTIAAIPRMSLEEALCL